MSRPVTRFAPSPTGPLHLGHAFAALTAASLGTMRLRIEDIDPDRCRPEWETVILDDLAWLGVAWTGPLLRQSERLAVYAATLASLAPLTYPCRCARADIRAALAAPQEGVPVAGPDGLVYPGTCRTRPMARIGPDDAIRLDAGRAWDALGTDRLDWTDAGAPAGITRAAFLSGIGDVVLARRGWGASYHLAVVVDDAAQGITLVTRGADLAPATAIHVLLQRLLDLPVPAFHHHRLIRDAAGNRLAKRDDARALALYRAEGATPADIRARVGLQPSGAMISTSAPSRTVV